MSKSYWIDGYFVEWWTGKSYFSHDRQIFVPKHETVRVESERIYITEDFAESQIELALNRYLNWSDKKDANLGLFVKALNNPWKKELSVSDRPPTSLP